MLSFFWFVASGCLLANEGSQMVTACGLIKFSLSKCMLVRQRRADFKPRRKRDRMCWARYGRAAGNWVRRVIKTQVSLLFTSARVEKLEWKSGVDNWTPTSHVDNSSPARRRPAGACRDEYTSVRDSFGNGKRDRNRTDILHLPPRSKVAKDGKQH